AACLDALLRALPPADPDADAASDHAHEAELTESLLELLPLLPSLAEDSGGRSRLFALRCAPGVVKHLLNVTTDEYSLGQKICTLFQATLRRLDDVDDEVRGAALRCAERILPLIPKIAGAAVQADSAYDVLLIHLDDPNPKFRAGVLDVLERIGQLYPESLCEKTREALAKFRNPSEPEELLKRLEACTVSTE
ncbi:HEAT repeat-containing protein 2, partial [Gryllus bimaculatus]